VGRLARRNGRRPGITVRAMGLCARVGLKKMDAGLWQLRSLLIGLIVLASPLGLFPIGWITWTCRIGADRQVHRAPFKVVLVPVPAAIGAGRGRCLRAGDMCLGAGKRLAFVVICRFVGAGIGLAVGAGAGLVHWRRDVDGGSVARLPAISQVLAAMRVALPEANPSIYLTLSLGVEPFPFNLTLPHSAINMAAAPGLTGG